MKFLSIVGARPQFIKAAVVSRAITSHNQMAGSGQQITELIVHTGQHYDANMSDIFFDEMCIPKPSYNLSIGGNMHGAMTGHMLIALEKLMIDLNPDAILVYGDTNSTLAGALAAAKLHLPVAHIEAGLRSFNTKMPEEINRILTDRVSRWLFCPTATAMANLDNEGVEYWPGARHFMVGDVMYDALLFYHSIAKPSSTIKTIVSDLSNSYYIATVHRAENTDDPERLGSILTALNEIADRKPVIIPLHPRTRQRLPVNQEISQNIILIDPVGYFDMLLLMDHCSAIFTDSGGVQKEAFFLCKPCITLRDETEWVELVNNGFNILTGTNREKILAAERNFIPQNKDYSLPLYGDGQAGLKLVKILVDTLSS